MSNVSRETREDMKASILAHIYEEIGIRDIAVVYVDVGDDNTEAEFYYPAASRYHVVSESGKPFPVVGTWLGRAAVDFFDAEA